MDCLADTGVNMYLLIVVAVSLFLVTTGGIYLSSRYKRNFKYVASVVAIIVGVFGVGVLPSSSVNAASNNTQCGDLPKSTASNSNTGLSNNNSNSGTTTPTQKVWNVPFTSSIGWNDFTHYTVSEQAGYEPSTLSASGGIGTITGNRTDGAHGNHRDFYIYEPAGVSEDGEVKEP